MPIFPKLPGKPLLLSLGVLALGTGMGFVTGKKAEAACYSLDNMAGCCWCDYGYGQMSDCDDQYCTNCLTSGKNCFYD